MSHSFATRISTSDHSFVEVTTGGIPAEIPILSVVSSRSIYYDLRAERTEPLQEDDTVRIHVTNDSGLTVDGVARRSPQEVIAWCKQVIAMCEQMIEEE